MFLLSCGRSIVSEQAVDLDASVSSGASSEASALELQQQHAEVLDRRRSSGRSHVSAVGDAQFRRLEAAMSSYDSMAARLKATNRGDFPALWSVGRPSRRKELLPSSPDSDEVPIPEQHVGLYQFFCKPQTWSPAFAAPGDFTLRMDAVLERDGEIWLRMAVVCCTVKAVREQDACAGNVSKRKSFVKFVVRSERELAKFAEKMALKYLGHRLMEKLPTPLSVLTASQDQLDDHGDAVALFLQDVLSISEIGYNGLLQLTEPVAKNLVVREFFDLSLGFGDPGMMSTSSCDARLEHRPAERPMLPSAWLGDETSQSQSHTHSQSYSQQSHSHSALASPRAHHHSRLTATCSSSRLSDSGYDSKFVSLRSPSYASPHHGGTDRATTTSKCIRYVPPARWHMDKFADGAFTVEITGVTIADGRAKYAISILYYARGQLQIAIVDRRYSEFDGMVQHIERKLRTLLVRNYFPAKTLFRYLSVAYLERRAAYLQRFLEKLLQMRFLGVLDQEISMVAEPNVRKFLQLPSVQWSIIPWGHTGDDMSASSSDYSGQPRASGYSVSPTAAADSSPKYSSSPMSITSRGGGLENDSLKPRYHSLIRRRSGSM